MTDQNTAAAAAAIVELTDDQKTILELQSRLAEIDQNHQWSVRSLENDIGSLYERLAGNIQWLIDDLTRDLKNLEESNTRPDSIGVNSLGPIQGLGDSINREAALLSAKKKELSALKRVLR
jgi:hypothetical protein